MPILIILHAHEYFYYIKRVESYKYWIDIEKLKQVVTIC